MKPGAPQQALAALQAYIAGAGGYEFQIVNSSLAVIERVIERYTADGDAAENATCDAVDDAGGMARILAEIRRKYDPLIDRLKPFLELAASVETDDCDAELLLDHRDANDRPMTLTVGHLKDLEQAVVDLEAGEPFNEGATA